MNMLLIMWYDALLLMIVKMCSVGYNLMGSVMQVEPSTVSKRR